MQNFRFLILMLFYTLENGAMLIKIMLNSLFFVDLEKFML